MYVKSLHTDSGAYFDEHGSLSWQYILITTMLNDITITHNSNRPPELYIVNLFILTKSRGLDTASETSIKS